MVTIRFIRAEQTLELRSRILRSGRLAPEECVFPHDDSASAFHLGCYDGEELVGVASFHEEAIDGKPGLCYRLRGMAVKPQQQRSGIGTALLLFALDHLRTLGCNVLWCNARTSAVEFYRKNNFEIFSPEFDIAGIGPHFRMKLVL